MAQTLADLLREHADFCDRAAAPLYGVLMRGMADDLDAGGPVAEVIGAWQGRPRGDVVQLRLLGALHRIVLSRQAPELATYYRSVGGQAQPDGAWPVARALIAARAGQLRAELDQAPQTNEVGRSVALAVGLTVAAARAGLRRVRLLEIGASAGLNLLVDRFRITAGPPAGGAAWAWGPASSPVDLAGTVHGRLPDELLHSGDAPVIVARRGCDLAPVDPRTEHGRLWLSSFVWPDHVDRFRRLAGALRVAEQAGAAGDGLDAASAGQWLGERLTGAGHDDVLTVIWHSIMWQYLDDEERARVTDAIEAGRRTRPLAHLRLESASAPYHAEPELRLDGELLATAPAHGVPVRFPG